MPLPVCHMNTKCAMSTSKIVSKLHITITLADNDNCDGKIEHMNNCVTILTFRDQSSQ